MQNKTSLKFTVNANLLRPLPDSRLHCLPTTNRHLRVLEKGDSLTFGKRFSYLKRCHFIWVSHLLAVSLARDFQLDLHQAIWLGPPIGSLLSPKCFTWLFNNLKFQLFSLWPLCVFYGNASVFPIK